MESCFIILTSLFSLIRSTNVNYCPDLQPAHDYDIEAILGMWYIREYIFHKENNIFTETNPYCPIVHLRKLEDYVEGGLINRNLVRSDINNI